MLLILYFAFKFHGAKKTGRVRVTQKGSWKFLSSGISKTARHNLYVSTFKFYMVFLYSLLISNHSIKFHGAKIVRLVHSSSQLKLKFVLSAEVNSKENFLPMNFKLQYIF